MRLIRRVLALLAVFSTIIVLFRYRQDVESTILETTIDAVAYAQAVEEQAASKLRTLPQVILHISGEEQPVATSTSSVATGPAVKGSKNQGGVEPSIITQTGEDGLEIKDTGAFWAKWSRTIYNARPTIPKIVLTGKAPTQRPLGGEYTRVPHRDHVRTSDKDLKTLQEIHGQFVNTLEKELGDSRRNSTTRQWKGLDIFQGRGVVMVGGGEFFGPAIVSINMLRQTGSTLPVEVFVPEEDEFEAETCKYLKKLNAKCVVLSHILDESAIKTSQDDRADMKVTKYQLKSLALLLSSFSDVLLLDSDSMPLFDPAQYIFDAEPYKSEGMLIWPDFWRASESPKFWTVAGRTEFPSDLPSTASEAGELAINKATHLAPLLLAVYYNIWGPDHYWPLLSQGALGQGDKETFLAAAVTLNSTFYRIKTPAGKLGRNDGRTDKTTGLVQHLPSDDHHYYSGTSSSPPSHKSIRAMFLHANTPKMNAGHLVDEGDLVSVNGDSRLRLFGKKDDMMKQFGSDVEKSVWDLLVQTGCELQEVVREWKERERMCERLEQHYQAVFG